MGKSYPLIPKKVPHIETKYRRIKTEIPVPESIPILEKLRTYEPLSMSGQPPVVWDHAKGVQVYDKYGNKWLDFSSGVLVTNAGHSAPLVLSEIKKYLEKPLLHNYCFPSEIRAALVEKIASVSPEPLKKVFLLTTGAEAVECAFKLARTYGKKTNKKVVISYEGSFHGRTLGAQMLGGLPGLKGWIIHPDPDVYYLPFPGEPRCKDKSFDFFERHIKELGIEPENVCAVISETYQGVSGALMPVEYAQQLRKWCDKNGALLIFDEIQAGFGRTGKMFGFQHYGIVPDIFCLGKGISSSLPVSAVVGKKEYMDLYEPGTMTSTHTGNPLCCAAALGSINAIEKYNLVENAAKMGDVLEEELTEIYKKFDCIQFLCGKGLVWGLQIGKKGTERPDPDTAFEIVGRCVEKGLLLFAPVGLGGGTIKINPPLIIQEDALREGCSVIREAIEEITG
ncbi:MAG: aspartate aminotransferase family protein [Candidatus Omnitrophica bacterium]|nr:aspartate aminotransferase family protein [Candidatus Omnitrophota bacterium]